MGNCPRHHINLDKVTECDIKINNILLPHDIIMQFQIINFIGSDHTLYLSDSEPLMHRHKYIHVCRWSS